MKAEPILMTLLIFVTTTSMARTVLDDINDQCREEVGEEKSKTYRECVEREEQRVQEALTNALIRYNRDAVEKSLGTAREMARRCEQVDTNSGAMTRAYCFERFRRAIATASVTTGCTAGFNPETLVLIREKLRSIWFFDTRSFLTVVEEALKENFNCSKTE